MKKKKEKRDEHSLEFLKEVTEKLFVSLKFGIGAIQIDARGDPAELLIDGGALWAVECEIEEKTLDGRTIARPGFAIGYVAHHRNYPDYEPIQTSEHSTAIGAAKELARLWFNHNLDETAENVMFDHSDEEVS